MINTLYKCSAALTSLGSSSLCLDVTQDFHSQGCAVKFAASVVENCHSMLTKIKPHISTLQDASDHQTNAGSKPAFTIIGNDVNSTCLCCPLNKMLTIWTLHHVQLAKPAASLQKFHKHYSSVWIVASRSPCEGLHSLADQVAGALPGFPDVVRSVASHKSVCTATAVRSTWTGMATSVPAHNHLGGVSAAPSDCQGVANAVAVCNAQHQAHAVQSGRPEMASAVTAHNPLGRASPMLSESPEMAAAETLHSIRATFLQVLSG
jgi:hypothetical protein